MINLIGFCFVVGLLVSLLVIEVDLRCPDVSKGLIVKPAKKPKSKNIFECMICHQIRPGVKCLGGHICHPCVDENSQ